MARLEGETVYVAEVSVSGDGQMLFVAFRLKDRICFAANTLLSDGTFLETEGGSVPATFAVVHAVAPPVGSGFLWWPPRGSGATEVIEQHRIHLARTASARRASPVAHDMTTHFAMRLRAREIADARDEKRVAVEDRATTALAAIGWIAAIAVAFTAGLLPAFLTWLAALLLGPFFVQLTGWALSPVLHRRGPWRRVPADVMLERAASIPYGDVDG